MQRLVLAVIWFSGGGCTIREAKELLTKHFGILHPPTLEGTFESLCKDGSLVSVDDDHYKITEKAIQLLERDQSEATARERRVRERFLSIVKSQCPQLPPEPTWEAFNERLLLPMVKDLGARTYALLTGTQGEFAKDHHVGEFIDSFQIKDRDALKSAIATFLDSTSSDVRGFILRLMNSAFLLEAVSIPPNVLDGLSKSKQAALSFGIVLDTNFIFSVLEFHDNPANEAAVSLIDLANAIKPRVNARLLVLPISIDEARRVLSAFKTSLSGVVITPNIAEALSRANMPGLRGLYFGALRGASQKTKASDFFDPYIKNLVTILRERGVELYNDRLEGYKTQQKVVDDILEQQERQEKRKELRPKSYDQLEHDAVLWHFIHDKRPAVCESPADAGYWVVTIDYRLLAFDKVKCERLRSIVPVCVHPTSLLQLLQFFVPRSDGLEKAVIASLRIPFLFHEFDPAAERATIRILQALARFENAGDLSVETISRVLTNQALRSRLSTTEEIERQVELVKEVLVDENKKLGEQIREERERSKKAEAAAAVKASEVIDLERRVESEAIRASKAETGVRTVSEEKQRLGERLKEVELRASELQKSVERERGRKAFMLRWILGGGVVAALSGSLLSWLLIAQAQLASKRAIGGSLFLVSLVWLYVVDRVGLKQEAVNSTPTFQVFHKARVWLFSVIGALVIGLIGSAIWEFRDVL